MGARLTRYGHGPLVSMKLDRTKGAESIKTIPIIQRGTTKDENRIGT